MKQIIQFSIFLTLFCPVLSYAQAYNLYLFGSDAGIRFDKLSAKKVSYQPQAEVARDEIVDTEYQGRLVSSNSQVADILFNIPNQKGAFQLQVPYYPHTMRIEIVKDNQVLDIVGVEVYNKCNSDQICQYERGEDTNTCLADCLGDNVTYSEETLKTLQANNGVIRDEQGTVLLSNTQPEPGPEEIVNNTTSNIFILIGGVLFLVLGIGLFFWKYLKK